MFNQNECKEELAKINGNDVYDPRKNTNQKFKNFYDKMEKLFDEMAPIQKLTKKEIGLSTRPWITFGILASMKKGISFIRILLSKNPLSKKTKFLHYIKSIPMKS